MIRCDLTDEELRLGDHGALELSAGDMAEELLAYRTARAASAERVREVVQREICAELVPGLREAIAVEIRRAATRAAEQLAGVGLSDEDRRALRFTLGVMSAQQHEMGPRAAAALDRLLASPAAPWVCPVQSNECTIRQRCTNKCGRNDRPAVDYLTGIHTILASDMPGEAMRKALEELAGLR